MRRSLPASAWSTSTSCWWRTSPVLENVMLGAGRKRSCWQQGHCVKARAELKRLEQRIRARGQSGCGDRAVAGSACSSASKSSRRMYRRADILILDEPDRRPDTG
ncbi:hypothetical protein [Ensifer canadensis]